MFRKPRNHPLGISNEFPSPSVGRPPSPPGSTSHAPALKSSSPAVPRSGIATKPNATIMATASPLKVPKPSKPKPPMNGSILNFFKKTTSQGTTRVDSDDGLFFHDDETANLTSTTSLNKHEDAHLDDAGLAQALQESSCYVCTDNSNRYNENDTPSKRRKTSHSSTEKHLDLAQPINPHEGIVADGLRPTSRREDSHELHEDGGSQESEEGGQLDSLERATGPFIDGSDSDDENVLSTRVKQSDQIQENEPEEQNSDGVALTANAQADVQEVVISSKTPALKREASSYTGVNGFEDFEGMEDFEDEYNEGEEFVERRWQHDERALEQADEYEGSQPDPDYKAVKQEPSDTSGFDQNAMALGCPVCDLSLAGVSDQDASIHVNGCLDGNPTSLPLRGVKVEYETPWNALDATEHEQAPTRPKRPFRPPRPGQDNPVMHAPAKGSSAFSKIMSGHAEDAAWATAAAAEHSARGKPSYQRTCPFYKIMPGLFICVDAFRYGAVQGCNAYFLSHFHSDHYVGLTSTWCHGPIYCSRPTANLVRQQLRVDPRYVVDLEFEKRVEVPGTQGVFVTMIPANHCPGSSLYLFEKSLPSSGSKPPRTQRILHCGDFRACPAHIEHPLLKPEVCNAITGQTEHQKIDVCYLDTTYLSPKYAFPSQEDVIQACSDMCISLNKARVDESDGYEKMKQDRAGGAMSKFVRREGQSDESKDEIIPTDTKQRGALLVIVGTYSIGKERICLGIARALNTLIFAPPGKQRICAALEDPELNRRLTSDPRAAQVHMTPLFEIKGETLADYLQAYQDRFSRCVGFRPSGWSYRPPAGRFTESPSIQAVLHSDSWKSTFTMRDLIPARGSTSKATCYGVPYSEHSSFRELSMFCCGLNIDKIIPTVNVGSAKSREKMKVWCDRWTADRKKNGLFRISKKDDDAEGAGKWYPGKGTLELRTNL